MRAAPPSVLSIFVLVLAAVGCSAKTDELGAGGGNAGTGGGGSGRPGAGSSDEGTFAQRGDEGLLEPGKPPPLELITAKAMLNPATCDRSLDFEVWNVQHADGAKVAAFSCEWRFSDGGSASTCTGSHVFANAGVHSGRVVVKDASSPATTTLTTPALTVRDPIEVDVVTAAPPCGLTFSYTASKSGGKDGGWFYVDITPEQNVLTPGPWPASASIEVSAPGTYTVYAQREEESAINSCTGSASQSVTVEVCP